MRRVAATCCLAALVPLRAFADPPMEDVLRAYAEVWNSGEVERLDGLVSEDFRRHGGFAPAASRAELAAAIDNSRRFYRDLTLDVGDVVANADKGAMRWRFTAGWGTTRFEIDSVNFAMYRFAGGKIAEEWVLGNNMDLFRTFGYRLTPPQYRIVPPPVETPPGPGLEERMREPAAELERFAARSREAAGKNAGDLEIRSSTGCRLFLDGEPIGWLQPDSAVVLRLGRGKYPLRCASAGGSAFFEHTAAVRKGQTATVAVKGPERVILRPRQQVTEDLATGLMWQMADNGGNVTRAAAEAYCRDLVQGGFDDWRLPTIHELEGLRVPASETVKRYRSIDGVELSDCCPWSATPHGDFTWTYAFSMDLRYLQYEALGYHMRALCVRDAVAGPRPGPSP